MLVNCRGQVRRTFPNDMLMKSLVVTDLGCWIGGSGQW